MSYIDLRNINKEFNKRKILDNFNLKIKKNDFIGIIGKSGSGKTTLLNIIGMIEEKDSGSLTIDGIHNPSIRSREAMLLRRAKVSYLFQNYGLVDDKNVFWNLNIVLEYKKLTKKEKQIKIENLLEKFKLTYLMHKFVYQLSGGEQQRIAIMKIFLQDCDIILADEPTSNLDSENEKIIMDFLSELNDMGKTIVLVTHNKQLIKYCNRTVVLK